MRLGEYHQCATLAVECFGLQLNSKELERIEYEFKQANYTYFSAESPTYFVATYRNKIVGVAGYSQSMMDWETYEFFWLCVDPKFRKMNIGSTLAKVREKHIMDKTPKGESITIIFSCLSNLVKYHYRNGYSVFFRKAGGKEVIMGKTFINKARKTT